MEKLLLYIKHHIYFLWAVIESVNSLLFKMIYAKKLNRISKRNLEKYTHPDWNYRKLEPSDLEALYNFFGRQNKKQLEFFAPHNFDQASLLKKIQNSSFIMFGAFDDKELVGYFFLRFFFNHKCFVGRIVDMNHQGKGVSSNMNNIMYNIAWEMKFRCLSTISMKNTAVLTAHKNNSYMSIVKELANNYILVEFKKPTELDIDL